MRAWVTAGIILALLLAGGLWVAHFASVEPSLTPEETDWSAAPLETPEVSSPVTEPRPPYETFPEGEAAEDSGKLFAGEPPARLWERWHALLYSDDLPQLPIVSAILAERLRESPDRAIYQDIAGLLRQDGLTLEKKAALVDLLREIATAEALTLLLETARNASGSPLYIAVLQGIARIGDNRWDGRFHEELSPLLEAAWSNKGIEDRAFFSAVVQAAAKVGAPSGVDLLLNTVASKTLDTTHQRQAIAFSAIQKVRNPDAVSVLADWFRQYSMGEAAFEASGMALARVGSPAATQVLLDWAQGAPAEASSRVRTWFKGIHDTASVQLLRASLASKDFKSSEVREVVTDIIGEISPQDEAASDALPP